jgi:hypothetical protein
VTVPVHYDDYPMFRSPVDDFLAEFLAAGVSPRRADPPAPRAQGPQEQAVAEDWPTDGWPTASHTREKACGERRRDAFERAHPDIRVVRLRVGARPWSRPIA